MTPATVLKRTKSVKKGQSVVLTPSARINGEKFSLSLCFFCATLVTKENIAPLIGTNICLECRPKFQAETFMLVSPLFPHLKASSWGRVQNTVSNEFYLPFMGRSGELLIKIRASKTRKSLRVHRLVCEAFKGPSPRSNSHVNHINYIRSDNRPSNLEWISPSDNLKHAGEQRTNMFLPAEDREIMEAQSRGESYEMIGRRLGRTRESVRGRRHLLKHRQNPK